MCGLYRRLSLLLLFNCLLFARISVGQSQITIIRDTTLTGYTRSKLTPLYYGLGTDRLGGARMETLDSGVVIAVNGLTWSTQDSTHKFWRIGLSPTLSAFVPTEQVAIDTLRSYPKGSLTGNWTVYGDSVKAGSGIFDYIAIRLPARFPYRSQQQLNPSRLVVDVFGLTVNTNWITQLASAREIRNVWFEQVTDETVRIFIDLKHAQSWGYSIYYQRNTLIIRVRRPPDKRKLRGLTIAVDAGHGGSNTGANGKQSGRLEKELTLDVANRLQSLLRRKGVRVVMTRSGDTLIGPTARILAMRQALPNLLVSIHFNSSANAAVRGVSTYYKHVGFRPLSQALLLELRKTGTAEFGNVGHFNFFFNTPTDYPNALVEGPFLSNVADENLILDDRFRQRMAKAIRRGLKRFVKDSR
ncbi:N-acetylmuramoyl-L-alanine amidase family protein [Spirosoma oryzicola]|uniref:N-acetylmuramoyl-L-alanine amidase family protein n=1 Tax=Spirosoma oryzicola TaxID=2898794 RepID=UPI001E4D5392|nr:N-acetylmuramoyl-L-alanine amidase [Spirosoma oryzicola]UHG92322.1 N-acetylmuramoyl-L-alanine amidase [Spirosoma oryzicola]